MLATGSPGPKVAPMRIPSAALLWLSGALALAGPAHAERRVFIIANNADGYGVDRCLAAGEGCGRGIAAAYCRARDFERALSFRRIDRAEITGTVPAGACRGDCNDLVAIECGR